MKTAPRWIVVLLLLAAACSSPGLAMPEPSPLASRTAAQTLSPATGTPLEDVSATLSPSSTASPTATLPPTITVSPTPLVRDSFLVHRPEIEDRHVVTVRWSDNGKLIYYALSPIRDEYLLKWNSFELSDESTKAIISPSPAFMDEWAALGLGYPDNSKIYSELLGYTSPTGKYLIFPNAGFPKIFSQPNYIYIIPAESGDRDQILGPTFRGTVGKAYWLDHETKVLYDYRYATGVLIFLSDIRTKVTKTLVDLPGTAGINTDWSLSPNQAAILLPAKGTSQILGLTGKPIESFQTSAGMFNVVWSRYSQAIYYWEPGNNHLKRYHLGDGLIEDVLAVEDLAVHAPVAPEWGMPFTVSPDERSLTFWHSDWIWTVRIR